MRGAEGQGMDQRSVLVVEDEVIIRLHLADYLREADFTVLEAATGDEALEVLRFSNLVAVVVTDFNMPGATDGLSLARQARALHPGIKIILVSAQIVPGAATVADAVFCKPCDPAEIVRQVSALMQAYRKRNGGSPPAVESA